MRLVCETVVNDILPAVRALIAKDLQEKGYTQTEIADLLDLTQPAVSQYLSAARGSKVQRIERNETASRHVAELIEMLLDDAPEADLSRTFCDVCLRIREEGIVTDDAAPGSPDGLCGLHD